MENKKTIIISFVILIMVITSLFLYSKFIPKPENSNEFLEENNANQTDDVKSVGLNTVNIKESNPLINFKLFGSQLFVDLDKWGDECVIKKRNEPVSSDYFEGGVIKDTPECYNNKNFKQEIYPNVYLNLILSTNPDEYNPLFLQKYYYLEINGKKFDLPKDGNLIGLNIENLSSIQAEYGCEECEPWSYYFNGEKWFSLEEIGEICIPKGYFRLNDLERLSGELHIFPDYFELHEAGYNTYDSYHYQEFFNNVRLYHTLGSFVFKCNKKDFSLISVGHRGAWVAEKYDIKYKNDFLDFIKWVVETPEQEIKTEYASWPNTIEINNILIRYPEDWLITLKEEIEILPDLTQYINQVYSLQKDDLKFSFDQFFFPDFIRRSIVAEEDKPIDINLLKILYIIKVNLPNNINLDVQE